MYLPMKVPVAHRKCLNLLEVPKVQKVKVSCLIHLDSSLMYAIGPDSLYKTNEK